MTIRIVRILGDSSPTSIAIVVVTNAHPSSQQGAFSADISIQLFINLHQIEDRRGRPLSQCCIKLILPVILRCTYDALDDRKIKWIIRARPMFWHSMVGHGSQCRACDEKKTKHGGFVERHDDGRRTRGIQIMSNVGGRVRTQSQIMNNTASI